MLSALIARVVALGVPPRLAKPLLAAIALIALVGAVAALRACDKRQIIEEHEAKQEAAIAKADRKADAKAAEERRADDARAATESQEIKEAITDAGPDPIARRRAYYECVRLQQSARAQGKPPADC